MSKPNAGWDIGSAQVIRRRKRRRMQRIKQEQARRTQLYKQLQKEKVEQSVSTPKKHE